MEGVVKGEGTKDIKIKTTLDNHVLDSSVIALMLSEMKRRRKAGERARVFPSLVGAMNAARFLGLSLKHHLLPLFRSRLWCR
jgi:hypothetical protein